MKNLLAQIPVSPPEGFKGQGPLGLEGRDPREAPIIFNQAISTIIGVITVIAFIWFTFQTMIGAVRIITSGGDKGALEAARKQITTGIIGLVVTVAGVFIVEFIGSLIGIEILGGADFVNIITNQFN